MAIYGAGGSFDYTFKITNELKTSTSQFKVVGYVPGSTTSEDRTVCISGVATSIAAATGSAYYAIGIIQSMQSASSENASVRLFGISRATCAESIPGGSFVCAYAGASGTSYAGMVVALDDGVSTLMGTTSITATRVVLGRALESGSTNTVISVFLNPQYASAHGIGSIGV